MSKNLWLSGSKTVFKLVLSPLFRRSCVTLAKLLSLSGLPFSTDRTNPLQHASLLEYNIQEVGTVSVVFTLFMPKPGTAHCMTHHTAS